MVGVLVTGASGFVGCALANRLQADGNDVVASLRRENLKLLPSIPRFVSGDIASGADWGQVLAGREVVVHCAARVHVLRDQATDPLQAFRAVNYLGTLSLARQAATAGVRRFVYVSSIGVNGAETRGVPFSADDSPSPHSPYALSKLEAEDGLKDLGSHVGLEVVIVRPPLVYGPDAPGNFASLVRVLRKGLPLPFGAVNNRRSYVGLDNFVDFLAACVIHPCAANQTFLVSDGVDISTADLLRQMGHALGTSVRLLPVPSSLLGFGARLLGKADMAQRLCGSLQVDISKTQELLGWSPPVSVHEGLQRAAKGYLREAHV